ncbi:MAG: hypothetical protein IJ158_13390 [Treponema sp.]|nr:hypothetical protein [Treponema sp.]
MSDKEVNTISHLLEVEQKATELASQAQIEADKKIAQAKAQADSEFHAQYKNLVEEQEKLYAEKVASLESAKNKEISEYKSKISAVALESSAFNSFLDSVLLA